MQPLSLYFVIFRISRQTLFRTRGKFCLGFKEAYFISHGLSVTTRYKFRKTFEQISLRAKQELSGSIFLLCRSPCIRGEGTYRPIRSSIATRCPSAVGLPSFTHFHFSAVDKLCNFSCLFNHLSAQLPLSPSHSKRRGNCQSGNVCFEPNRCSDLPYRPPGTVHCSHSFGIAAVPKNIILHLRRIFPPPFPSSL